MHPVASRLAPRPSACLHSADQADGFFCHAHGWLRINQIDAVHVSFDWPQCVDLDLLMPRRQYSSQRVVSLLFHTMGTRVNVAEWETNGMVYWSGST